MHNDKMLHACIRALFPSPVLKKLLKKSESSRVGAAVAICIFALSYRYEHTAHAPELNFQWVLDLQKVHKLETPFKSGETWFCKQGGGSADEMD